jgi:hypothetical protein
VFVCAYVYVCVCVCVCVCLCICVHTYTHTQSGGKEKQTGSNQSLSGDDEEGVPKKKPEKRAGGRRFQRSKSSHDRAREKASAAVHGVFV